MLGALMLDALMPGGGGAVSMTGAWASATLVQAKTMATDPSNPWLIGLPFNS